MSAILGHRGLLLLQSDGGWSPAMMTYPPSIWLDDASPVTDASGYASQWSDRSGNGYNFAQSSSGNRPLIVSGGLNGRRVLRFDGANDSLFASGAALNVFSGVSSGWMLTVIKKTSSDASPVSRRVFVTNNNASAARIGFYSDDATSGSANRLTWGGRRTDGGAYQSIRTSSSIYNDWVIALGLTDYSARTLRLYRNGELDASASSAFDASGSTSATTSNQFAIGGTTTGGTPWAGDMALAMAGVALPDAGETDKLIGWAAWRYGLQGNLPPGHPYKDSPP